MGYDACLIPAQNDKIYLRGQKNDYRDAEAIAEAVQRPRMRIVPLSPLSRPTYRRCIRCVAVWCAIALR